jgi:hypothetical protein
MGSMVTTKFKFPYKIRRKPLLPTHGGTYAYQVLPFGRCNTPTTFQRDVLGIFSDLIHDCIEIYMDNFTVYRIPLKKP